MPNIKTRKLAKKPAKKVWAGRLSETSPLVEQYTSSIAIDKRLYPEDIECSLAHAQMLHKCGLLSAGDLRAIEQELRQIKRDFEKDSFKFSESDEDIHTAIERRLIESVGKPGEKLHTARSRNDQVATDLRLYGKKICRKMMLEIANLQEALITRAKEHQTTLLPGYTHGQRAQVISLAHYLLSYVEMLQRDIDRFAIAHDRCNVLPLGSGALAATTLPINRQLVAEILGFEHLSANSLDAVSDRDFTIDIVSACANLMVHLSRASEEFILWSSSEFAFCELPDAYATGSSIMPQKKNPDIFELTRGRTATVIGHLTSLLTMVKGLPLAYNRDLQEDKTAFFPAVDTSQGTLQVFTEAINLITFNVDNMRHAAADPALMATDVADYLVLLGVPFREAHRVVGQMVQLANKQGATLADVTVSQWQKVVPKVTEEIKVLFDLDRALRRREVFGGPGPKTVGRQLVRTTTLVARTRRLVAVLAQQISSAKEVGARK